MVMAMLLLIVPLWVPRMRSFRSISPVNPHIFCGVVNIPITQGKKNQGQEVRYHVSDRDSLLGLAAMTVLQVSWTSSVMISFCGGEFSFTHFPAVSTDLVLTELTATKQPFRLASRMLIDLFVLWIYMKGNQKQFSLAHLVSANSTFVTT